ncbi:MAG: tyrosine-type recombinase/integrase [Paracoccaceae bacterium]
MPKLHLTKSVVEKLQPANNVDIVFWDIAMKSFGIRIKPNGSKSYIIQYRNRNTGRSRRMTIGQHGPLFTLNQAREIARGLLSDAARGADPVAEKKAMRAAPTMSELADRYLLEHAIPKKRANSIRNDRSMLDRHILPKIGKMKVSETRSSDIAKLHNNLVDRTYQANRVLALLSKMFSLAIRWELRPDNPANGIEKFQEEKRTRWLNDDELNRLVSALNQHPNQVAADAIRLQLLTGSRIGEVLEATWGEFDLDRGVWTKPSHHTKQKRTEHLPLSDAAMELLSKMRERGGNLLIPSSRRDGPMTDLKYFWRTITKEADLRDYRIHDNRHSYASHLVSSGLSLVIVGRLLGHTNPSTTLRYAHLADDPLRKAAEVMGQKMSKK